MIWLTGVRPAVDLRWKALVYDYPRFEIFKNSDEGLCNTGSVCCRSQGQICPIPVFFFFKMDKILSTPFFIADSLSL